MNRNEYSYKGFRVVITDTRQVVVSDPLRKAGSDAPMPEFAGLMDAMEWISSRTGEIETIDATCGRSKTAANPGWTVTYTARRKRSVYERQTVTVKLTLDQYRTYFGEDYAPDEEPEHLDLEMLAVEHGVPLALGWDCYLDDAEDLDPGDFEILVRR